MLATVTLFIHRFGDPVMAVLLRADAINKLEQSKALN